MTRILPMGVALLLPLAAQTNLPPATPPPSDFERITQSNRELLDLLKKQQAVLEDIQHDRSLQSRQIATLETRLDAALQRNAELQSQIARLQSSGAADPPPPGPAGPAPVSPTRNTPLSQPAHLADPAPPPTAASFLPPQQSVGAVGEKWWHRLFVLTGTDSKTTPLFHVQGKNWRVVWHNLDPALKEFANTSALFISAFPKDDTIPQQVCARVGSGGDTGMLQGPGNFYLKIEASGGSWALTVEDLVTDPK